MGTKCKFKNGMQIFSSTPQMISAGGNVTSNQQVVNSTTETVLITETIYANTLNSTSMSFRVFIAGEISSDGSDDITFTLRYGTTDILELTTAALANEDDMPFKVEYTGHVLTAGASGKIVSSAFGTFFQGTPLYFASDTANTGASVDLTANGSLNITGKWDDGSTDTDIIVTHGWIEFYN
jgi:hypothetical protein